MISAVFFLRCEFLFRGASAADLLVDFQQLRRQLPKAVIGLHLALRLVQFGRRGKGLGDGLSLHLAGQANVGAVSGLVGLMASAVRFAAGAAGGGNGSAAKVGEAQHLLEDGAALLFQINQGWGHGLSVLHRIC